jgi:AraC family transcriptional regulator, regulatory protein of adaptative response / methylated-DNA-[protein]-cysteine methyltransferase
MSTATVNGVREELSTEKDPRWASVVARDRDADRIFFYSVATTGVYCRPSCGARRPNPGNVRFHRTREDAARAGFRPCKRCKPDEPPLHERYAATIASVCRTIEAGEAIPSLAMLAKEAGLSVHHFHRVFKSVTGLTPRQYGEAHRSRRVREELRRAPSVTAAIYDAGFNSSGRFYAAADEMLGMTPSEYRAGGAHAEIRFAVGECSLGSILVARSERGVCAILLGDEPEALVRELQDLFPRATLVGNENAFERVVSKVVGFVDAPALGLDLPLDVRGTAFQQRVWRALQEIPPGSTASYSEIAARLGAPKAFRSVAQACAANPLAVAIPCHRVVRRDGRLSGYRWGAERKRALLKKEGASQQ